MTELRASAELWAQGFRYVLPIVLPRFVAAWLICLLLLLVIYRLQKPRVRFVVAAFDASWQQVARRLRYRTPLSNGDQLALANSERVLLTWFFRFWTNFASAPSLSVICVGLAIAMLHLARTRVLLPTSPAYLLNSEIWILPIYCYFGSMGLSYVLKRVVRRARPLRENGAFGHRLKDGSFPSGHSLTAFCFWTMCALIVKTPLFVLLAAVIIALTGLSRIYMAVHWPSDVVGGYAIGVVWTTICFFALNIFV